MPLIERASMIASPASMVRATYARISYLDNVDTSVYNHGNEKCTVKV